MIIKVQDNDVIIDDEDASKVSNINWYIDIGGYVCAMLKHGERWKTTKMHRLIMGFEHDYQPYLDHINRNKLDNRKENLRICNASQNNFNTVKVKAIHSKYKGVCFHKGSLRYTSQIKIDGFTINLHSSSDEVECAFAYNVAVKFIAKDFGFLNTLDYYNPQIEHDVVKKIKEQLRLKEERKERIKLKFRT